MLSVDCHQCDVIIGLTARDLFYTGWFNDLKLKCWGKLEMWHRWTYVMKYWFYDFELKCWEELEMLEVDRSAVDLDLESIFWLWVEKMSFSVDLPTVELDPELILRLKIEMSRKFSWPWPWIDFMPLSWNVEENQRCLKLTRQQLTLTPDWFYDFKLKCWKRVVMFGPSWFYSFNW